MPVRHSYIVPMRWVVIYECEVPGRALYLNSTKLSSPWSPWESSPSRKNPHCKTGNWTWELVISSQELWPLDHEAGHYEFNILAQKMHSVKLASSVWVFSSSSYVEYGFFTLTLSFIVLFNNNHNASNLEIYGATAGQLSTSFCAISDEFTVAMASSCMK
jgi:hypothetical protein